MKPTIAAALCAALAAALGGCSTTRDAPLLFGSSNVVGISIGASAASSGGDFTLGYKGHDFALVPVTVRQPDGSEIQIGYQQTNVAEAYSVLGQFGASAGRESGNVKTSLGKFFATGLAARNLATGFGNKLSATDKAKACAPKKAATTGTTTTTTTGATTTTITTTGASTTTTTTTGASTTTSSGSTQTAEAGQSPAPALTPAAPPIPAAGGAAERTQGGKLLLFAQITALGFSAGSSAAETGIDLTLGYKDANVAVVPVTVRDSAGYARQLRSRNQEFYDSYSVLGQFSFDASQGAALSEAGLGKFFSTGGAALRLSEGFGVRPCDEHAPVAAPPSAAPGANAAATGSGNQ